MKNEFVVLSKKKIICMITGVFLCVFALAACYLIFEYSVTKVTVEGNEHYSDQEIKEMVLKGGVRDNSILLSMEYHNKPVKNIPFVESLEVEIVDRNTININVYEKALAGCVEYLSNYMYFDREGIIVESSGEISKGIPVVTGLQFEEIVLHQKLPVEDEDIFSKILNLTQLLDKYHVDIQRIHFERNGCVILYYGEVRINLGQPEKLDEKIMELPNLLPSLEDKSGVLRMEDYHGDSETVTFEADLKK